MTTVVLTIAGSDPSGGAGIQADLRAFAALGAVGVSAITALTVQNSLGVQAVYPVPADVLAAQLEAILSDTKVRAVKIGMLGGADQVRAVAAALRKYGPPNVVLDPVLASTGGVPLLDDEGCAALLTELMPLCGLVTPNLDEVASMTGIMADNIEAMETAGKRLIELGAKAVLVKGGHLTEEPSDLLLDRDGNRLLFFDKRILTPHSHGTGCLLSSGIAAYLGKHWALREAVGQTKNLLTRALLSPIVTGAGSGYPNILAAVTANGRARNLTPEDKIAKIRGVYVVTDSELQPARSAIEVAQAALAGGAAVVQLRDKHSSISHLVDTGREIQWMTRAANALFIVNDRVDVTLTTQADGVHLGPDDMTPADARRLLGRDRLIGVSVATVEEARAAAPWASYFGVGAIFGTQTKLDAGAAIGVGRIAEIKAAFPNTPIVAIGGINAGNIAEVARAGADAAAVVSAVVAAPDMEAATRELVARFEAGKAPL